MYWLEFIRPNLYDHIIIANMLNITYTMYLIVCMHVCMHVDYLCTVCVYAPLHVIGIYLGDPISRRRLGAAAYGSHGDWKARLSYLHTYIHTYMHAYTLSYTHFST